MEADAKYSGEPRHKEVGLVFPAIFVAVLSYKAWAAYHIEIQKGRNEAWSRGSALGSIMGTILLGAIVAALFSIGKPFRTWRAWLIIEIVISAISCLAEL